MERKKNRGGTRKMFKPLMLALALLPAAAYAASDEGVSGAQFLRIGAGAEAAALGEACAAISGAQSLFYNPAGLAGVAGTELSLSHVSWIMDTGYSSLAAGRKGLGGAYGLAVNYLSVPSIDKYDKNGDKVAGGYSAMDMVVTAGYARELGAGLSAGADLKYLRSKLDSDTASAEAVDAGLKYAAVPGALDLGFAVQNLGTSLKFSGTGDSLPLNFKLGGRYLLGFEDDTDGKKTVALLADVNRLKDAGVYANAGADFTVSYASGSSFSLRGGYRTNMKDSGGGSTFGLGVGMQTYRIDYAYSPMGDLGAAHHFSVTLLL